MLTRLLNKEAREMKCSDFNKAINRYADGEMDKTAHAAMRQHASVCSVCRRRVQEIHRLTAVLATDRAPDVPPGFACAVMRRARTIAKPQRVGTISFLPAWWHAMTHPARIAAAAMFAVSMGFGALMGWDAGQTQKSPLGAVKPDLVAQYSFDYFAEAPAGSLAQAYLALAE